MEKKQFEVNLTRGLAYRHGSDWNDDNARYIKAILRDFKVTIRLCSIALELDLICSFPDARRTNYHRQFQSNDRCTHVLSRLCLSSTSIRSHEPSFVVHRRQHVSTSTDRAINGLFLAIHLCRPGGTNKPIVRCKNWFERSTAPCKHVHLACRWT